jgi:hypothetical protein
MGIDADTFGCRACGGLMHRSAIESHRRRLMWKARKIRERLGQAGDGLFGAFPRRPKGMHRSTYWRLVDLAEETEQADLASCVSWIQARGL